MLLYWHSDRHQHSILILRLFKTRETVLIVIDESNNGFGLFLDGCTQHKVHVASYGKVIAMLVQRTKNIDVRRCPRHQNFDNRHLEYPN